MGTFLFSEIGFIEDFLERFNSVFDVITFWGMLTLDDIGMGTVVS